MEYSIDREYCAGLVAVFGVHGVDGAKSLI